MEYVKRNQPEHVGPGPAGAEDKGDEKDFAVQEDARKVSENLFEVPSDGETREPENGTGSERPDAEKIPLV